MSKPILLSALPILSFSCQSRRKSLLDSKSPLKRRYSKTNANPLGRFNLKTKKCLTTALALLCHTPKHGTTTANADDQKVHRHENATPEDQAESCRKSGGRIVARCARGCWSVASGFGSPAQPRAFDCRGLCRSPDRRRFSL